MTARHWLGVAGPLLAALLLTAAVAFAATPPEDAESRLDLNSATLEEIRELPIDDSLARAIVEHRTYRGFFETFFDLRDVEGMTPADMAKLRPLVATLPPDRQDEALERYDESFRQVERFLSQEGASEELADELLDQLRDPQNLNDMSLYELMSLQNVSPVDAVAVLKSRERMGLIEDDRQLRNAPGLSYWGYRNLRDFVVYEDTEDEMELHGDVQYLTFNTPYQRGGDERDILFGDQFLQQATDQLTNPNPAVLTKLRLRLGSRFKGGVVSFREVGEDDLTETVKGYASYRDRYEKFGGMTAKVVLGNYRVAFGQGLVMDNTDFFLPRKTGYGWNKRPQTIFGDLSRTNEFMLRGAAVEVGVGRLHGIGFVSRDEKDAVMNAPDGDGNRSINRYIVMTPRFEQEVLDENNGQFVGSIERDAFEETTFGGNLKLELFPGTYVGVSGYEARYDQPFDPQTLTLFNATDRLDTRDTEIFRDYSSEGIGDFRRVVGSEFQAVYENVAFQGEYAKLDSNPDGNIFDDAPEAFLVNGYVQYGDFNLLALYRDYDVGFDNPYARAFSNDTRYEQTLLGDPFRLNNELLAFLAANTPQMKPEQGFFMSARYRISRRLTITGLDFDQWTRKSDGQDLRRYTLRMEYQPIWPLRFRLRQRYSSRAEDIQQDVRGFQSWDTRLEARLRLSAYDELRFLYSSTNTSFAPRPRLSELPGSSGPDSPLPQAASPSQALQAQLRHNVNEDLMVMFTSLVYDGFLWNFEDNEFVLLDGQGFRNWVVVRSRLSDNMLMRFKVTHDNPLTRTSVLYNRTTPMGDEVREKETSFRLQLDYTF